MAFLFNPPTPRPHHKELNKVVGERQLSSGNKATQTGITETVQSFDIQNPSICQWRDVNPQRSESFLSQSTTTLENGKL